MYCCFCILTYWCIRVYTVFGMSQDKNGEGRGSFCQRVWWLCVQSPQKQAKLARGAVFWFNLTLVVLERVKRCSRLILATYQRLGGSGSLWFPSFCKKERQRTVFLFRVVV